MTKDAYASGSSDTDADAGSDGEKHKYYEFDIAVAPDSCGSSADNLELGFCPYGTSIVLISATIVNKKKMLVCGVTSTKAEWKIANADLKRVQNSFFVEPYTKSNLDLNSDLNLNSA